VWHQGQHSFFDGVFNQLSPDHATWAQRSSGSNHGDAQKNEVIIAQPLSAASLINQALKPFL
jgi:hypothetical protein